MPAYVVAFHLLNWQLSAFSLGLNDGRRAGLMCHTRGCIEIALATAIGVLFVHMFV